MWRIIFIRCKKRAHSRNRGFLFSKIGTGGSVKITDFSPANLSLKASRSIEVALLRVPTRRIIAAHDVDACSCHYCTVLPHLFSLRIALTIAFAIANLPESAKRKKIVREEG